MDHFVARQPIFDTNRNVFAYELLFRSGFENYFSGEAPDVASARVIGDSVSVFGLDALTWGKKALIKCTQEVLTKGQIRLLPAEFAIVELVEGVKPEPETLSACKVLKDKGYLIAINDFGTQPKYQPLMELSNILRVDFLTTKEARRRELAETFIPLDVELMARKVETREDMNHGLDLGYSYFQGNFYEKPEIVARKDVPAFKYNYLKFMKELNAVDMSYKKMEQIIKQEMSLSVKLLRYINSAFFGLRAEVKSIGQAIRLLGELQVKRWGSIVSLAGTGEDKPSELVMVGMVRGRLCELLTDDVKYNINALDAFLVGMLSVIDALLDRPMKEVLRNLSIAKGVSGALLGEKNHLRQILDLVLAFENGQWEFVKLQSKKLGLEEDRINILYLEALDWSIKVFNVG